ncbi:MAG: hypothetical protein R3B53_00700 [Candidatus Paceibacterota bacterium]
MQKRRGEITPLKNLFNKYKNTLIAPQKTVEMEMVRVVGEVVGITLKESQVAYTVSTRTIAIIASGMIKQEVKIKNKLILAELKKHLGAKGCPLHII